MASAPLTAPTHHVDDIPSISATLAAGANASNTVTPTSEANRSPSPPTMNPAQLGDVPTPEVSKIEASDFTGVTFKPELWMQRRHWALEILREAGVRSVLDVGCGVGSLLEPLSQPPSTVREPPILCTDPGHEGEAPEGRELFISHLGAVDINPGVMAGALKSMEPPAKGDQMTAPRWEPMTAELWLGNIERYNSRFEPYEALVMLEVIEHLEPQLLSRFGVVTLGTYRPKLLLVSTPNFDFNSKFPHQHDDDSCPKGFADPTGRTDRVFRHSDHKCEMTSQEFREWAIAAASDWGYDVQIGGVGISSKPSYYPDGSPVYATQTAVFRLASGIPMRSPRSVRTVDLPFMRGVSEAHHPHRLAGKFQFPATAVKAPGAPLSPEEVNQTVQEAFKYVSVSRISLTELWGLPNVAAVCGGSKRHLVSCLGGWGDCKPLGSSRYQVTRASFGLEVGLRV